MWSLGRRLNYFANSLSARWQYAGLGCTPAYWADSRRKKGTLNSGSLVSACPGLKFPSDLDEPQRFGACEQHRCQNSENKKQQLLVWVLGAELWLWPDEFDLRRSRGIVCLAWGNSLAQVSFVKINQNKTNWSKAVHFRQTGFILFYLNKKR